MIDQPNEQVYIALLRGINVGGKNTIAMAQLKTTFEQLSFSSVKTYINSGNIIFCTTDSSIELLESNIEDAVERDFGIKLKVIVLDYKMMKVINQALPANWTNDNDMKCDVLFLAHEINKPSIIKQLNIKPEIEDVIYVPAAIFWRVDRINATKSNLIKIVSTSFYKNITVRNCNTVRKLYGLMQEINK